MVPAGHCQLGLGLWHGRTSWGVHKGVKLSAMDQQRNSGGRKALQSRARFWAPMACLALGYLIPVFCDASIILVIKIALSQMSPVSEEGRMNVSDQGLDDTRCLSHLPVRAQRNLR